MTAIGHLADQNHVVDKKSGQKKLIISLPYVKKFQVHILNMGLKNYRNLDIFSVSEKAKIG